MPNPIIHYDDQFFGSPTLPSSTQNTRGGFIDGETEEEHAVRLRKISEEVKADMEAGRYRHGQLRPEIDRNSRQMRTHKPTSIGGMSMSELIRMFMDTPSTLSYRYDGRGHSKHRLYEEIYGKHGDMFIMDSIPRYMLRDDWRPQPLGPGSPEKPEKDWERTRFISGPETPPSDAKRAKLRAKRKKRK